MAKRPLEDAEPGDGGADDQTAPPRSRRRLSHISGDDGNHAAVFAGSTPLADLAVDGERVTVRGVPDDAGVVRRFIWQVDAVDGTAT